MDAWEGLAVAEWERRWGVPALRIHDSTTSTNDRLAEMAEAGAPAGTTVLADAQTRGRGRRGRGWTPAPGSCLLMSMLFRPPRGGGETLLSLRLGLAAARAIERLTPLTVAIKWPNDLFVDHYKVGGILCEGAVAGDGDLFMVAGIGLNVGQSDDDWPDDLRGLASSLEARAGRPVDRAALAGEVIGEWLAARLAGAPRLDDRELEEFHARDLLLGRDILVDDRPAGLAAGIDTDGALRTGSAERPVRVLAGTVRLDPHTAKS